MDKVKIYYPTHPIPLILGVYLKLSDWSRAKRLWSGTWDQPISPEVQKGLIRAYTALDMKIEAKRSQTAMEIINQ